MSAAGELCWVEVYGRSDRYMGMFLRLDECCRWMARRPDQWWKVVFRASGWAESRYLVGFEGGRVEWFRLEGQKGGRP